MDAWQNYDALDFESVVRYGDDEDEEFSSEEGAFMRGYLGMGEI